MRINKLGAGLILAAAAGLVGASFTDNFNGSRVESRAEQTSQTSQASQTRKGSIETIVSQDNPIKPVNQAATVQVSELNYGRLYSDIKRHEGVERIAYNDSRGFKTIGAGFNLDRADARYRITSIDLNNDKVPDLDFDKVYDGKVSLTDEQINYLMKEDIDNAIDDARVYLGKTWSKICPDAREIIINIAYNRGRANLKKFKGVKRALDRVDYVRAADELEWENPDADKKVHTNWYNRTGRRAKELIARMKKLEKK